MNLSLCVLIFCIAGSCLTTVSANENANSKKGKAKKLSDEFPDDEDVDGSGDFTESSGSGLPPDDDADHPHKNFKPEVRNGDDTIPFPTTIPKTTTTPPPVPKPAPEPPFDVNPKPKPAEPTQNENKDVHPDGNYDPTESKNRALIPKKTTEEERTHDRLPEDKNIVDDNKSDTSGVYKVNNPDRDRPTSFFSQPGILAAIIGGAVVGLLCAILVVMFIVYRMRKKDEGSYPLEEMKRCPASNPYMKPAHREFFA